MTKCENLHGPEAQAFEKMNAPLCSMNFYCVFLLVDAIQAIVKQFWEETYIMIYSIKLIMICCIGS